MKLKTIKRIFVTFLVNHVFTGTRFFDCKRRLLLPIGYEIGENTKIVGPLFNTGTLRIGTDCWIGRNLTVHGNGMVVIGNKCDIAPDVTFFTDGHAIGEPERRAGAGESYSITVGNGVWIGGRDTVVRDTLIPDGSVVADCTCVVSSVSPDTLVAGVLTKVMKEFKNCAA